MIRNTSDTKVQVLASTLDVRGTRIVPVKLGSKEFASHVRDADLQQISAAERHIGEESTRAVRHGRLVDEGTFFEARETITVPVLTWVPKDKYNALYLEGWLAVGRGKALGIDEAMPKAIPSGNGVAYLTRLPEAGWLRRLTRGDRYLRVEYRRDPNSCPLPQPPRRRDHAPRPAEPP